MPLSRGHRKVKYFHSHPIGILVKAQKKGVGMVFYLCHSKEVKKKETPNQPHPNAAFLGNFAISFRRIWFRNLRARPVWIPWRDLSVLGVMWSACSLHN